MLEWCEEGSDSTPTFYLYVLDSKACIVSNSSNVLVLSRFRKSPY